MDPAVDRAANPESNGANVPDGAPLESVHAKDAAPAPSSPPSPPLSTPGNPQPLQQSKPQINRPDPTRGVPSAPAPAPAPAPAAEAPPEANPYIDRSPAVNSAASKSTMDTVKSVLKRWGKKVGETAKKAEDLSRNTWQHLNTGPSLVDATMGRIAQGTKVIAEGGYEKIFRQTFDTLPEEQLKKSYACYLSTSAGPVMGVLYLSSTKLAFCSDNPLSYKVADQTEWSYYKVVIPLNQLKAANPSISKMKSAEKYIQVVSTDNHEFWFMGFMNYDNAVKSLQEALRDIQDSLP